MSFSAQLPLLELQYVDSSGSKGTVTMKAPLDATVDTIFADGLSLAALIAPVTSAELLRVRVIFKAVATPRVAADGDSAILHAGAFFAQDEAEERKTIFSVPAILDSLLISDGCGAGLIIDLLNEDVVEMINQALALPMTDPFGNEMASVFAAYRQSRR